ncbi:hypothetical protein ACWD4G_40175 [Streptomyces sp. NPDC002643]
MEPISIALLAALAGGAGGEFGRQTWAGLRAAVDTSGTSAPSAQS